jgi:hypothetical protein
MVIPTSRPLYVNGNGTLSDEGFMQVMSLLECGQVPEAIKYMTRGGQLVASKAQEAALFFLEAEDAIYGLPATRELRQEIRDYIDSWWWDL